MLFFDDCNWGDHCAAVGNGCREKASGLGPVTVGTPRGYKSRTGKRASRCQKRRDAARANSYGDIFHFGFDYAAFFARPLS